MIRYINIQNQFHFVANAQLFYISESNEISPMSNIVVNVVAAFQIFIQIIGMLTKQLQFVLMNIVDMNSDTSTIDCWFDFARKYRFSLSIYVNLVSNCW